MATSESSDIAKSTRAIQETGEEIVTDIISLEGERDIEHALGTSHDQNDPCCSGTQPTASVTHLPSSSTPVIVTPTPVSYPPPPASTILPLHPSYSSPPMSRPNIARTRGFHFVSMSDVATYPPRGPPPSYSKSIMDRHLHPCTSIQFVAPIPPPSYDGLPRPTPGAIPSGFTIGLGNTWQRQPQPAYCPVCEAVIITRLGIRTSRVAHMFAVLMCVLLCWPFCLLPYFIGACNHTIHQCSVCNTTLGVRGPFQRS